MKNNMILCIGTGAMALTVAIGAFGAHGLKPLLIENQTLDTFETAVRYQFYHALALLMLGGLVPVPKSRLWFWSIGFIISGIILFSGSLYIFCLTGIKWLGAITPIGGSLLIAAWSMLTIAFAKRRAILSPSEK